MRLTYNYIERINCIIKHQAQNPLWSTRYKLSLMVAMQNNINFKLYLLPGHCVC
jgi:hypothetical protein